MTLEEQNARMELIKQKFAGLVRQTKVTPAKDRKELKQEQRELDHAPLAEVTEEIAQLDSFLEFRRDCQSEHELTSDEL